MPVRRPPKRPRQVASLAEREKERQQEREKLRVERFRMAQTDNPYHGGDMENPKKRRENSKMIMFPGVEILVSKDTVYQKSVRSIKEFPWKKLAVTFALILLGGVGSAVFHARNANIQTEINRAERSLRHYLDTNFIREEELRERYTFHEIERIATERLGMAFPDASQVIIINVPRVGGVMLNTADYVLPRRNYFREDVVNFFTGIFNRIFGGG